MASDDLPLALTMGDPAGVGPSLTWQAWLKRNDAQRPFYVVAPPDIIAANRPTDTAPTFVEITSPDDADSAFQTALPVLPVGTPCPVPTPGTPDVKTAQATIASIEQSVTHVQRGKAAAIVTNPIAKALLYDAGFKHPGHTEFLAHLANPSGPAPHPIMMLVGGGLKVALVTIHIPFTQVADTLTPDLLEKTIRTTHAALQRDFGLDNPRIGLCGLNPHAGENGTIGTEETDTINPTTKRLQQDGINVSMARPGDTIFHEAREGRFDAVIAMYHDQGLIPVKTLDIWGGVNTTLGLPFVRTSPDHGVAYEAAAQNNARPDSLLAAIRLADQMATHRANAK